MATQRQDYILRQIDLLRQFVARLAGKRVDHELDEALLLSFHLQEKLFPLPPVEFLRLDMSGQIAALRRNEPASAAREKCLAYASLLAETASLYEFKGREELASGARQLALYAALCIALENRTDPVADELISRLLASLDGADLHPPTRELLDQFEAGTHP